MSKICFWLLDITYELEKEGSEIWLWGLTDRGERVLLIDRRFLPYFYLSPEPGFDPSKLLEKLRSLRGQFPSISDLHLIKRRYFGKPLQVVKAFCRDPRVVESYAKQLRKLKEVRESYEEYIRFSSQYLIDHDVAPCSWHEVEVAEEEVPRGVSVDKAYAVKNALKLVNRGPPPELRVLGFSAVCYSKLGSPKPERDPVVIISVATSTGEEKQFIAEDSQDSRIIESFVRFVRDYDPDVIVGYYTNRGLWPYLVTRAKTLGIDLRVNRMGSEPHTSLYGHMSVAGRANVDFYDFAEDIPEVKVKTLENVADFLGVRRREERVLVEEANVAEYWEDGEKRPMLLKHSMEDVRSIMGISNVMLDFAMQLASLVKLPLDHVGTAAVGFRVESFLIDQAHKLGELVPRRLERPYIPYAGAIVLKPQAGIHEDIAILDAKSMYPSLMISKNISPDTYLKSDEREPPSGVNVAPKVGYRFRKEPPGFYKQVLSKLIEARSAIKEQLKKLDPDSPEYRVLNARQKAIKVVTNACYGYAGWIGSRWYSRPVAEATTAWGRETIVNAIKLAEEVGLKMIYGDTDSIFVSYDPDKVRKFLDLARERVGLEVELDKLYKRVLFTEAKKRYAGLTPEGRLDVVGLEVVRGDWATIAKRIQEGVLRLVLEEKSREKAVEKAISLVRSCLSQLWNKQAPYADLVIWKALTKPLKEYAVRAPHVEAAKLLEKTGMKLTLGDKVGYVITKGPGKLLERAKPYIMASYDDIDLDYYANFQVIPAALRVLSIFGVTEQDLAS